MKCMNLSRYNCMWLTVVIALVGVVLAVSLLLVKMTGSSGTINGFIPYANIIISFVINWTIDMLYSSYS